MQIGEKIKKTALNAVRQAGKMALKEYEKFDRQEIMLKSKHEIVTRADLLSEEIILSEIYRSFPTHGIISEEQGARVPEYADTIWIVDPIDGTTNFSIHNPLWCISIAVARLNNGTYQFSKLNNQKRGNASDIDLAQAEIFFGAVFAPFTDELFIAEKGRGAFLEGKRLKVSPIKSGKVLHTFCHGKEEKDIKKAISYYSKQKTGGFDCRQLGSAALELAYVAAGRIESIMIPGANLYDVAAGVLLVEEAGGKATDFKGKEWNPASSDMLATNGLVHKAVLAKISK